MSELRRLLICEKRLIDSSGFDNKIFLDDKESHYLRRVLRLKKGDYITVVDGCGNQWKAYLENANLIKLSSSFNNPLIRAFKPKKLSGLAVVLPKRGFEDVLRMSCEMGIDIIQPLTSDRYVPNGNLESKYLRWKNIIREALEQSERLWMPELRETIGIKDWLNFCSSNSAYAIATTRIAESKECQLWMDTLRKDVDQIWIAVGPEGGWSIEELELAYKKGFVGVKLGGNILRTSTAAIVATNNMVNWMSINYVIKK